MRSYFSEVVPGPVPSIDDAPFWASCEKGVLKFQRCANCKRYQHPPTPACPRCKSFSREWIEARDEAELYSFTVVHYPPLEGIQPRLPYNVAIVRFPSFDNVRLISNVVDADPDDLRIGMKLYLTWEECGSVLVPRFRKSESKTLCPSAPLKRLALDASREGYPGSRAYPQRKEGEPWGA